MGLHAGALRSPEAASAIPAILFQRGHRATLEREDEDTRYFVIHGRGRPLHFRITKQTPPRFLIGVGRRGDEIIRVLAQHDLFLP